MVYNIQPPRKVWRLKVRVDRAWLVPFFVNQRCGWFWCDDELLQQYWISILCVLLTTITVDEPTPGLKAIFSFKVPDQRSGNVELQYLHDYAGVSTNVGLTANPIVNLSAVLGTNVLALGVDLSYDTKSGDLTKSNAVLSFTKKMT